MTKRNKRKEKKGRKKNKKRKRNKENGTSPYHAGDFGSTSFMHKGQLQQRRGETRNKEREKKMKKMNERIFLLLVDVKPLVDALGVEVVLARKALQLASFLVLAETNGTNSVLLFH